MKEFYKFIAGLCLGVGLYCLSTLPHLMYAVTRGCSGVKYSELAIFLLAIICAVSGQIIIKSLTDE